jgi:hypothetical protein
MGKKWIVWPATAKLQMVVKYAHLGWAVPGETDRGRGRCRVARFLLLQHTKTAKNVPTDHKMYKKDLKCDKWQQNIPNRNKKYQHFPFQGLPKYTWIGNFGMKITLVWKYTIWQHWAIVWPNMFFFCTFDQWESSSSFATSSSSRASTYLEAYWSSPKLITRTP